VSIRVDGFQWSAPVLIKSRFAARDGVKIFKLPDSVELTAVGSSRRSVTLLISNASIGAGGRSVQVSSPFWLLNESELPLLYREVRLGLVLRTQDLAGRSVVRAASAQHIRSSVDDALQLPARSPMSKRRTTSPLRAHARQAPERVDDGELRPDRLLPRGACGSGASAAAVAADSSSSSSSARYGTLDLPNESGSLGARHEAAALRPDPKASLLSAAQSDSLGGGGGKRTRPTANEPHDAPFADRQANSATPELSSSEVQIQIDGEPAGRQDSSDENVRRSVSHASVRSLLAGESVGEEAELRSSMSHGLLRRVGSNRRSRRASSPRNSTEEPFTHASTSGTPLEDDYFEAPAVLGDLSKMSLEEFVESGAECGLFSFGSRDLFSNRLSLRVRGEGNWSSAFSLDVLDTPGCLRTGGRDLGVIVTAAPGLAVLSKVVIFAPRWKLINNFRDRVIYFWETAAPGATGRYILPGESVPFHRSGSAGGNAIVQIAMSEKNQFGEGPARRPLQDVLADPAAATTRRRSIGVSRQIRPHAASGPFSVNDVGSVVVSCPVYDANNSSSALEEERLVQVKVTTVQATVEVLFIDMIEEGYLAPFAIRNLSSRNVRVQQCQDNTVARSVPPGTTLHYVWDAPLGKKELAINFPDEGFMFKGTTDIAKVRLDLLGGPYAHGAPPMQAWTAVTLSGVTRVLTIWDAQPTNPEECEWLLDADNDYADPGLSCARWSIGLALRGCGVSLVHSEQYELAYLSLAHLTATLEGSLTRERLELTVGSLQLDNQLASALLPVVLSCKPRGAAAIEFLGAAGIEVSRRLVKGAGPVFEGVDVRCSAVDLQIEERFVSHVGSFIAAVQDGLARASTRPPDATGSTLVALGERRQTHAPAVWYYERLALHEIKVNVTYMSSQRMIQELLRNPVHIPSISRLPLTLNAVVFDEPFLAPPNELAERVGAQYKQSLIRQVYKLVLDVDTLSQPASLVRNLGVGVKDFIAHPFGHAGSVREVGKNVLSGSVGIARGAVSGALSAFAFVTGKAAGAVAHLSFDERYLATREKTRGRAQQPSTAVDGLARGGRSLGTGVMQGITGIVVQPARGYKEAGALGFAKGLGKGLVGLGVKPAAGVLDLLSRTAQGAANQTRRSSSLVSQHRARPPRTLYGDKKVVREYVHAEAAAHEVLAEFRAGKHRREPLAHCVDLVPQPRGLTADVAILTDRRLMLAEWKTKRVLRHISLDDVESFEPAAGGAELLLTTRQREPWQATVSSTQQQMQSCMRSQRHRHQDSGPQGDTPTRSTVNRQAIRLECTSEAACRAFVAALYLAQTRNRAAVANRRTEHTDSRRPSLPTVVSSARPS